MSEPLLNTEAKPKRKSVLDAIASAGISDADHKKADRASMRAKKQRMSTAKGGTAKEMEEGSEMIGKAAKRMSMAFDALVPAEHALSPEILAIAEDDGPPLQTNGEAVTNMLNNCLGSGMLGVAFTFAQCGLGTAILMIICSALVNKYTMMLNLDSCEMAEADPGTTEIAYKTFGSPGQALLVFMYTVAGFACLVSYVDASSDAIAGLLALFIAPADMPSLHMIAVVAWVVLLVPPTLMRSMKMVAVLSFVAFVGGMCLLVCTTVSCAQVLAQQGLPAWSEVYQTPASMSNFLTGFPIIVFLFSIQPGGAVVLATMQDTSKANQKRVANFSYILVFSMNIFLGGLVFYTFRANTQGDMLANFSSTSPAGIACRVAVLDLVVLSYMIMIIPCKFSILDFFFGKNEGKQESSLLEFYGVTMTLNVAAFGVAILVPNISVVFGLTGAIITNFVAFILPAAFRLKIQASPVNKDQTPIPILSLGNLHYFCLFIFGCCSLVVSTNQCIKNMSGGR